MKAPEWVHRWAIRSIFSGDGRHEHPENLSDEEFIEFANKRIPIIISLLDYFDTHLDSSNSEMQYTLRRLLDMVASE